MAAPATRERLLDALQRILVREGLARVTLEAVAAEAGVSKGGLLYHFRSKEALLSGLVDRLDASTERRIAEVTGSGRSIVRYYLETSTPSHDDEHALHEALIATLRTVEGADPARAAMQRTFDRWYAALLAEVGDPVLARTVQLVGDGLYLNALSGLASPPPDEVRAMFERLYAAVGAPPG